MKKRDILATIALPYANGPLHLGHLIEAIQADIWVRFQKHQGHTCAFVSGSDAHGTAVMLSAEQQQVTPEQRVAEIHQQHRVDFSAFGIGFDEFYTTHSAENEQLSQSMYLTLVERGDIDKRKITQAFDAEKSLFLSDRYIKGTCPRCNEAEQYGDNCEACGATYSPMEMVNPVSVLSGTKPIEKDSEHHFFRLNRYREMLECFLSSGAVQDSVANKLREWFADELQDWDISRDAPYFGFRIPGEEEKYFYVWLDAPIGYIASAQKLSQKDDTFNWQDYWKADSSAELHHFIGKDIVYFHALFWPAILEGAGFRKPSRVHVHGYVTINGQKMSKSRGTFITASRYAKVLPADCLRYYYAAKLSSQVEDIDLSLEDFMARVNADLVGKFVNLASRCAGFITKRFAGIMASRLEDESLYAEFVASGERIRDMYDALEFNKAIRMIMSLADKANQYIDQHQPWALIKQEGQEERVQMICSQGLNMFRVIAVYLSPILVDMSAKIAEFLNDTLSWETIDTPLLEHTVNRFKPLLQRVTVDHLEELVNATD